MKIVRSKVIGYCFGVSNTIEKAEQCIALSREEGLPCYSIGAIIHNKDVVKRFSDLGMRETKSPAGLEPGIALIRAHGIADSVRRAYEDAGFKLIDSTCPIVAKGAATIRKAAQSGNKTIIIGVRNHAETLGLQGVELSDGKPVDSILICSVDCAKELVSSDRLSVDEKIVVVVQTTFSAEKFQQIREILKSHYKDIRFSNEPCGATAKRQKAAAELAELCDAVMVIGGKSSENTKGLATLVSEKSGKPVYCIENKDDLDEDLLKELSGYQTVGICSGSSTPTSIVREVEEVLENL